MNMKTIILDATRIERITHRIAYQVMEHCYQQERITVIGMQPRGTWVAEQIVRVLERLAVFEVDQMSIDIASLDQVESQRSLIEGRHVILIDDVIKSGYTMMMAAGAVMRCEPKQLITASLVDRKHRRFPIQCDFTGLSLATTIQESLRLSIEPEPKIYLE